MKKEREMKGIKTFIIKFLPAMEEFFIWDRAVNIPPVKKGVIHKIAEECFEVKLSTKIKNNIITNEAAYEVPVESINNEITQPS